MCVIVSKILLVCVNVHFIKNWIFKCLYFLVWSEKSDPKSLSCLLITAYFKVILGLPLNKYLSNGFFFYSKVCEMKIHFIATCMKCYPNITREISKFYFLKFVLFVLVSVFQSKRAAPFLPITLTAASCFVIFVFFLPRHHHRPEPAILPHELVRIAQVLAFCRKKIRTNRVLHFLMGLGIWASWYCSSNFEIIQLQSLPLFSLTDITNAGCHLAPISFWLSCFHCRCLLPFFLSPPAASLRVWFSDHLDPIMHIPL